MDQHDGDLPRLVRLHGYEVAVLGLEELGLQPEKSENLKIENRHILERVRERGGRLELKRDVEARQFHGALDILGIDFQSPAWVAADKTPAHFVEAEERGHGHFDPGAHQTARRVV